MTRRRLADQQPGFDGGLNTISDESALQPNQMRRATNARLTDFGGVTKRGGTQRVSTNAVVADKPVQNGYTWLKDNGTREIMVVVNGTLYTTTYGTFPWTFTSRTGALSTSVNPTFAQFRDASNDVVYIADGFTINKWNGTTLTVSGIGGTVNVSTLAVHNQRLWGAGDSNAPDSIFYSNLNNGDTFSEGGSGGGQIVVRTFADETVVGLASVNTSLLIFHRRGISRLTGFGQDDITVAPQGVTADVGVIAPKSIVSIGNLAYFVSERGLFACNEAEVMPVATKETPDPLLPIIRSLSSSQFDLVRAVFNRATRELWISIPGVGCYQYHTLLRAWSGPWDTGWVSPGDTTTLFETLNSSGLPVILRGDASGWVSLCDAPGVFLDNVAANNTGGTAYTMTVQLHRLYCGDDATAKALRFGYLTANLKGSGATVVEWQTETDFLRYQLPTSSYGVWDVASSLKWNAAGAKWPNISSSANYRVQMGGTGYGVDVSVVDTSTTNAPILSRFQLETFALGRR